MGRGGSFTQRIDITDSYDPRLVGRAAQKGTLFRYIPSVGDPEVLIKADDGYSVNWVSLSSGVSPITIVDAAGTGNINLANLPANIDGIVPTTFLAFQQADQTQNGVYNYTGAGLAATRVTSWSVATDFIPGRQVFVNGGLTLKDKMYMDADYVVTLGVTPIVFVTSGGAAVVGDPNTLAFFNASGDLVDNLSVKFDETALGMAYGVESSGGSIPVNGFGSFAHGQASDAGSTISAGNGAQAFGVVADNASIQASNLGSHAFGAATTGNALITSSGEGSEASGSAASSGQISASQAGAKAHGSSTDTSSAIVASGKGSHAFGTAETSGNITTSGFGSQSSGYVTGGLLTSSGDGSKAHGKVLLSGTLDSSGVASHAHGLITSGAVISASGAGASASGLASDAGTLIEASSSGSVAHGYGDAGGQILSSNQGTYAAGFTSTSAVIRANRAGAHAHGYADDNSLIGAQAQGATAFGRVVGAATIIADASGSFAGGFATGTSANIQTSAEGAIAFGRVQAAFSIIAGGFGSLAIGVAENANHSATGAASQAFGYSNSSSGDYSATFGKNNINPVYACFTFGRFGAPTGSDTTWVATDPAFVFGNGTGIGAENIGYRIDKDGRVTETAAKKVAIRLATDSFTLSARTDYKAVLRHTSDALAQVVTLPAGENGLEFIVTVASGDIAAQWSFATTGPDVLDGNVPASFGPTTIVALTFLNGTWYNI